MPANKRIQLVPLCPPSVCPSVRSSVCVRFRYWFFLIFLLCVHQLTLSIWTRMLKISICCRLRCWLCLLFCLLLLLLLLLLQSSDNHFFAELQLQPSFASWCDLRPLCGINVGAAAHKSSSCNLQRVVELAAHNALPKWLATSSIRRQLQEARERSDNFKSATDIDVGSKQILIIISKVAACLCWQWFIRIEGATPVIQLSSCQSCHSYWNHLIPCD